VIGGRRLCREREGVHNKYVVEDVEKGESTEEIQRGKVVGGGEMSVRE